MHSNSSTYPSTPAMRTKPTTTTTTTTTSSGCRAPNTPLSKSCPSSDPASRHRPPTQEVTPPASVADSSLHYGDVTQPLHRGAEDQTAPQRRCHYHHHQTHGNGNSTSDSNEHLARDQEQQPSADGPPPSHRTLASSAPPDTTAAAPAASVSPTPPAPTPSPAPTPTAAATTPAAPPTPATTLVQALASAGVEDSEGVASRALAGALDATERAQRPWPPGVGDDEAAAVALVCGRVSEAKAINRALIDKDEAAVAKWAGVLALVSSALGKLPRVFTRSCTDSANPSQWRSDCIFRASSSRPNSPPSVKTAQNWRFFACGTETLNTTAKHFGEPMQGTLFLLHNTWGYDVSTFARPGSDVLIAPTVTFDVTGVLDGPLLIISMRLRQIEPITALLHDIRSKRTAIIKAPPQRVEVRKSPYTFEFLYHKTLQ
ncbi:hypothetical protein Pelo_13754 [Pelomyxa schiedti]|nr:hypothetical protein Pelo_13754 [Pelomyxa schiedti]